MLVIVSKLAAFHVHLVGILYIHLHTYVHMIYICVYDIHMCVYMIYIYIWIKSHHLPILTGIDHPKKTHIKINIAQALHAQRWRNHKGSWTGLHSVGFASAMAELSENVMCIYIYILSTVYNIGINSL